MTDSAGHGVQSKRHDAQHRQTRLTYRQSWRHGLQTAASGHTLHPNLAYWTILPITAGPVHYQQTSGAFAWRYSPHAKILQSTGICASRCICLKVQEVPISLYDMRTFTPLAKLADRVSFGRVAAVSGNAVQAFNI